MKLNKKKPEIFVVQEDDEDDPLLELPNPNEDPHVTVTVVEEDGPSDSGRFELTWLSTGRTPKVPGQVIELKGLDPERVYGVECQPQKSEMNRRVCRPARGDEVQARWRTLFDYGAVHHFEGDYVRKGYRLLRLRPKDPECVAICYWEGPKYVPQLRLHPRKIKFGKPKQIHEHPQKRVSHSKAGNRKVRARMGRSR